MALGYATYAFFWPRPAVTYEQTQALKDIPAEQMGVKIQQWSKGVYSLFGNEERRLETITGRTILIVDGTGKGINNVLDMAAVREYVSFLNTNNTIISQRSGVQLSKRKQEGVLILIPSDFNLGQGPASAVTRQMPDGLWISFINVHPQNTLRLSALATELSNNFFHPEVPSEKVGIGPPVISGEAESVALTLSFMYQWKVQGKPFHCSVMRGATVPGGNVTCLESLSPLSESMPGKTFFR